MVLSSLRLFWQQIVLVRGLSGLDRTQVRYMRFVWVGPLHVILTVCSVVTQAWVCGHPVVGWVLYLCKFKHSL